MGLSDYFGRFWFAAEPVFGIVMTLCFLAVLRNQALYAYPNLLDRVIVMVVAAAISCCIAWGIVDGIFYAWENHHLAARKWQVTNYAKDPNQKTESSKMIEEDLQDTYVDSLDAEDKKNIYDKIVTKLSAVETRERTPIKDDVITVVLDMGLNVGACLAIIIPLVLLRNVFGIGTLLNLSVVIAIALMFIIGAWTETRKNFAFKVRKGILYAVLGILITLLTYFLGG
jgi:hypothetical protein